MIGFFKQLFLETFPDRNATLSAQVDAGCLTQVVDVDSLEHSDAERGPFAGVLFDRDRLTLGGWVLI
jgi:hypothetical protein